MPSLINQVTVDLSGTIQNQHQDRLDQMQSTLDALKQLHQKSIDASTSSHVESLVKRIVCAACTVPDSFFLSDACETVHELFADYRILLGYFDCGKTSGECFELCYGDVVEDCANLVQHYRRFLRDPEYSGTAFPKPEKIIAMRRMSRIMAASKLSMPAPVQMESRRDSFLRTPQSATILQMPPIKDTIDVENLLRVLKPPATPELKPQNLPTSALLEAVKEVMPQPPAPPARLHPVDLAQMPAVEPPKSALEDIKRNLLHTRLRPPQFVDEDGDVLPHSPPPQTSPVLSDSDSFMAAFRQYAKKQQERRASTK